MTQIVLKRSNKDRELIELILDDFLKFCIDKIYYTVHPIHCQKECEFRIECRSDLDASQIIRLIDNNMSHNNLIKL